MNKKGFTFIELLAVIVLISVVLLIAVPTIRYADKKFHKKSYNTKSELILNAAKEYGDDYKEIIMHSSGSMYTDPSTNDTYPSVTITIRDLLNNGYVTKDNDIKTNDILDPRDDSSMLDKTITIYIKNNRAYAKYN